MATIETIRRIRIQQISEGGDAARRDLLATASAQQKLGDASTSAAVVTDLASKRQLSAASAYQKVAAQLDQSVKVTGLYERALTTLDRAISQGVIGLSEYDLRLTQLQQKYGSITSATEAFAAAQKQAAQAAVNKQTIVPDRGADIAAYGKELDGLRAKFNPLFAVEQQYEKQVEQINRALKVGAIGEGERTAALGRAAATMLNQTNEIRKADEANTRLSKGVGLNAYAWQNLSYQINDVVTSLASGISPMQTFTQQGGQIFQILQSGQGGVSGALKGIGNAAGDLAKRIGPVGGAVAGLAVSFVAAAASALSFQTTQEKLAQQLSGIGRASGTSVGQINAIAPAIASAGNVSVRTARDMAGTFAATGKIGSEMYLALGSTAKDYAATTGQALPDATKALAEAFADPAKGADTLNTQLGILSDTTRENIQRLAMQGDRLGAQKALLDAYKTGLTSATELTSAWGRTTAAVGVVISDAWDKIGQVIDRVATGGDLETQLATAQKVLANSKARSNGTLGTLFPGMTGSDTAKAQADVDALLKKQSDAAARSAQAQQNEISTRLGAIVRGLDPAREAIKKIEDQAKDIADNFGKIKFDEQGQSRSAMAGLLAQAKQLREDLVAGGSQFADSIRAAQFGQRTVGFTQQGLSAAQINQSAGNKEIDARRSGGNQDDLNAKLQSIEMERVTLLQTLEKQTTLDQTVVGGAFSRMSASLQASIVAAASNNGKAPANIIAALAEHESGGDPNIGFTKIRNPDGSKGTAYGLGQITAGTERAAIRGGYLPSDYDRMDNSRGPEGIAGVYAMKLKEAGGDPFKALKNYYGSDSDTANTAYANKILRNAGQMGDPSTQAQGRSQDEATRAIRDNNEALKNANDNYGKNGLALDAAAQAQQRYNALIDAGVQPSDALAQSIKGMATAAATAAQQTKLVQFGIDNQFDREQLGRSQYDQGAYAKARSLIGDTSSPAAKSVIDQSRETAILVDAKNTASSALTGFATDVLHGASAAKAASTALGKLADTLLSKVLDSIVSSAFGSATKGGLGSLFGFANGGIMSSKGSLPLHAYATGGVANSPQMAVFGEGRMPEAYVPLPDGKRIPVTMAGSAANSNSAPTDARSYNIDLRGSSLTREEVRTALTQAIASNNADRDRTLASRTGVANRRYGQA